MNMSWDKTKFDPVLVATVDSQHAKTAMPSEKPTVSGNSFCMENIYSKHIETGVNLIHLQKKN
jgi:hypothetical protein